ncbi:RmlC-like cupin [Ascodesmis nigricans]|uniref:Mannose-6-phosphate isomerase n=1 Tax=Ascodesmis nigricans TaxID=341454 RepID=A0A4S2MPF0_9PEZI|nr:RmlC-like cupin [Ascodesmis nigricans]
MTSSSTPHAPFLRLRPHLQPSPYGKPSGTSLASLFTLSTTQDPSITSGPSHITLPASQTYGELWLSDHPSGVSFVLPSNTPLSTLITDAPDLFLTHRVQARFNEDGVLSTHIPFIFKILSFDKPLPLQSHPPRDIVQQLRARGVPGIVDKNHKPEVAISLSDTFSAFIGFRPLHDIKLLLEDVPEFDAVVADDEVMNEFLRAPAEDVDAEVILRTVFTRVLAAEKTKVKELCEALTRRVDDTGDEAFGEVGRREGLGKVWRRLWETSKGDVGVLAAVVFCNYVCLKKGEGVAVPAGCIHAYVEGDVVECMAWSDNMIAHGLQDPELNHSPELLADTVTYNTPPPSKLMLEQVPFPRVSNHHTTFVKAPIEEFDLLKISLKDGEEEVLAEGIDGPSVFIITKGQVLMEAESGGRVQKEELKTGQAVFVMPGRGWKMSGEGETEVWGAFVEGK